jgi:hypothetical protein
MRRTIIIVALAAGTFGGMVGALTTAATQSQASPQAVAAAVQRVSDTNLTAAVKALGSKLDSLNGQLAAEITDLGAKPAVGASIRSLLSAICENGTPVAQVPVKCF